VIPREREQLEELAEEIWALMEIGENTYERVARGSKIAEPLPVLEAMRREGMASLVGDKIVLTGRGEEIGRAVIRRHRLAEILFSQVLALAEGVSGSMACEMEHILSPEVTDSVCSFLGHPPSCPHGKSIPRGDCCRIYTRQVSPLVMPLTELGVGERCRIVFMAPATHASLERIAAMGVLPGAEVRLRQKRPSIILEVGHTTLAIDPEIAAAIFVRSLPGSHAAAPGTPRRADRSLR
jgi:DtxR family Mn-dependent transcriptional regulator